MFVFKYQNLENKILKKVKAKLKASKIYQFCHFSRILYDGKVIWKYASFRGSEMVQNH